MGVELGTEVVGSGLRCAPFGVEGDGLIQEGERVRVAAAG